MSDLINGNFNVPSRYEIMNLVGRGSQGVIMSAFDTVTNEQVAVKKLSRPFANSLCAKRAYREFALLNLVNHQNIIRLLNAFTPDQNINEFSDIYLVLEIVGGNLLQLDFQNLDNARLSYLIYQMFCGVNHLHKSGIMHRDLKPENIGITRQCKVKILDFGLARTNQQESTTFSEYVVARYYRAPEIILGADYDENVDVWSLGCIIFQMVTQTILFRGKSHDDQWNKIIEIIGSPNIEFYQLLSDFMKNYLIQKPQNNTRSWETILPNSNFFPVRENSIVEQIRDLLSKMIVIDPRERIRIRDAINHSFVNSWINLSEIDGPPSPSYNNFIEQSQFSVEEWKKIMFDQIKSYENQNQALSL
uniref:Stress-activated protein kinase JNK n=1 Tax=Panagrolaimus sp. PS1159 TaxID=55785 RepID=A0AC35FLN1_9BILA